jgi:hypothetical protein
VHFLVGKGHLFGLVDQKDPFGDKVEGVHKRLVYLKGERV